jgi:hypothetical protein
MTASDLAAAMPFGVHPCPSFIDSSSPKAATPLNQSGK